MSRKSYDVSEQMITTKKRISDEVDDVLATITLINGDAVLEERLFGQLTELMVESMFLELRGRFLDGELTRREYVDELATFAGQCRSVGLLPLPTKPG